jgi:Ca2+-binding EF-hand superfamily protein
MRKFLTLSLAVAALAGAAGVAYAQAGEARPALTRAQVEQRSAEAFARLDANDDGVLNPADREAGRKAAFDRLDADDSGAISFEEFSALREQRQGLRAERRGPGRRGGPRTGPRTGQRMARAADTNRDGTVTQAEFASAALARFDRIDVDKDGTISDSERPARRMRNAG